MSAEFNVVVILVCLTAFVVSEHTTTIFQLKETPDKKGYEDHGTWRVVSRNGDKPTTRDFISLSNVKNQTGIMANKADSADRFGGFKPKLHPVCLNEGLFTIDAECLCRPGFTGKLCEKGCGPNRFGENCENQCSDELSPRECRGMMLCTPDFKCECGPGWKGPKCDQPCEKGKYGSGCRQACGQCANNQTCDRHTGWCSTGCQGTLLPPLCREECGRKARPTPSFVPADRDYQLQYPWNVGIFDRNFVPYGSNTRKSSIEQICGGTLISRNIVISAAHCFYDERVDKLLPAKRFSVAFGKRKRGWDAVEEFPERTQKRLVEAIHIPPDFHGVVKSKEDDIAVMVLATPVDETLDVIPACFDRVGGFENKLGRSSVGYVAGWGRRENNMPSEDLIEAYLPFLSRFECLEKVTPSFRPYVLAKDRFCAGENGGAYVNRGDSGGGLMFLQGTAWFLRGMVSVAPPGEKDFSAYTNASYHRDWIVDLEQVAALRKAYIHAFFLG